VDPVRLGHAGLHGWKEGFADRIAKRAPVADDVARAALGGLFFFLSLRYVIRSIRAAAQELRT
jgi:hypothetical protein